MTNKFLPLGLRAAFLLPVLWLTTSCHGQPLTPEQRSAIDSLVVADIPEGAPGVAVGIVRDGQVIYERYAGLADLDTGRPITAATRFNMASAAKQFTAIRTLLLEETGRLDLDDDIRKYFPKLLPGVDTPITIAHLINHSSGLRDVYDLWSLQGLTWWKEPLTNTDALELMYRQEALNFPPGTDHLYSNTNYILLAELIAKVTGRPFQVDMDLFFTDLGLASTSFRADTLSLVPELARPYFRFDDWLTYELPAVLHGDGGLFTTLRDQMRWERIVQGEPNRKLSSDLLTRSQLPLDTTTSGYAFGLENGEFAGYPVRYHDGSTGAWKASVIRFPTLGLSVVALNNTGKFFTHPFVRDIARVLLPPAGPVAAAGAAAATGGGDLAAATAAEEAVPADYAFDALNGSYYSSELDVVLSLEYIGEQEYAVRIGEWELTMSMATRDRLTGNGYTIDAGETVAGAVTLLRLQGERVRNVRFERRVGE